MDELISWTLSIVFACGVLRAAGEVLEAYLVGRRSRQNIEWYANWLIQIDELEREGV